MPEREESSSRANLHQMKAGVKTATSSTLQESFKERRDAKERNTRNRSLHSMYQEKGESFAGRKSRPGNPGNEGQNQTPKPSKGSLPVAREEKPAPGIWWAAIVWDGSEIWREDRELDSNLSKKFRTPWVSSQRSERSMSNDPQRRIHKA